MKISKKLTILFLLLIMLFSCSKSNNIDKSANNIKNNTLLASVENIHSDNGIPNWKEVAKEYGLPLEMNSYELNNQGYSLYEDGLYDKAASLFQKAIDQDQLHPFASYNLACMLSLMMESGTNIDTNRIKELLIFELSQDPSRFENIKQDKDLTSYRNTDQYKKDYKEFIAEVLNGRWIEYVDSDYETFILFNSDDYSIGGHGSSHYADEYGTVESSYFTEGHNKNNWEITDDYNILISDKYITLNGTINASIKKVGYNYIDLKTNTGVTVRYYRSTTPLHEAVIKNDLHLVKKSFERKVNINSTIFNFTLIDKNKDRNSLQPYDFEYSLYRTPLYYAIKNKNIEMIGKLIEYGAVLNPKFEDEYFEYISLDNPIKSYIHPPFYAAIENDDIKTAEILLNKFNLDLNKDKNNTVYLLQAALIGSPQMIDFLISKGMDVNKKYYGNRSILDYFKNSEDLNIINQLKKHGAK